MKNFLQLSLALALFLLPFPLLAADSPKLDGPNWIACQAVGLISADSTLSCKQTSKHQFNTNIMKLQKEGWRIIQMTGGDQITYIYLRSAE